MCTTEKLNFIINLLIVLIQIDIRLLYANEERQGYNQCLNRIYRECTHESSFTEQEIENVRLYLQKRFSKTIPLRKPCERIHVRKDIKCLLKHELDDLIHAMKQLYANGVLAKFAQIHDSVWPQVHKFDEGLSWHRWFINEYEKELMKVNPSLTLPYWEYFTDFAEPHRSIVFDYFGHGGQLRNAYCVADGAFANLTLTYPKKHCLRRQWNDDGTLLPWESPEWMTAMIQMGVDIPTTIEEVHILLKYGSLPELVRNLVELLLFVLPIDQTQKPYTQFEIAFAYVGHFKPHTNIGGLNGDYSFQLSVNDPLFFIFHAFSADLGLLKYQLSDDRNLAPGTYGLGIRYAPILRKPVISNLETDFLTYYSDVRVKETFQVGYGDLCYIHDQLVRPINELMKNESRSLPEAVYRLKATLPDVKFQEYFPKFALYPEKVTIFDYTLPDISGCNPYQKPMPIAKRFVETIAGQIAWDKFETDLNVNLTGIIHELENFYLRFTLDLNQYPYSSPFVL